MGERGRVSVRVEEGRRNATAGGSGGCAAARNEPSAEPSRAERCVRARRPASRPRRRRRESRRGAAVRAASLGRARPRDRHARCRRSAARRRGETHLRHFFTRALCSRPLRGPRLLRNCVRAAAERGSESACLDPRSPRGQPGCAPTSSPKRRHALSLLPRAFHLTG